MSYHLVTREEITEITIYTRVEQLRSAIIPIRLRNITTKVIQDAIEKYELIGEEEPDIE